MKGTRAGRYVYGATFALAAAFAAHGQSAEQTFIKDAVRGNLAEVRLGELAVQRAESEAVRKFGETVRVDHHAALQRALNLAKSLQVDPPTEPTTEAEGFYEGLAQLSGAQFDAAFVSHMITAHEAEIAAYSRTANSNDDAVAAMIADTLPKLRAHLATAQALQRGAHEHRQH
jgi:putative membrane protein